MAHAVTLICPSMASGESQSPVASGVTRAIAATGVEIEWQRVGWQPNDIGAVVARIRETGHALLPYLAFDRSRGEAAPIVSLRRALSVWGNIRPVECVPGLKTRHPAVDILVVRETTEDIYASLEHESIEGVYESLKVTTKAACERIARHAFELARARGREKVTIVHKANIMKKSDGLFLSTGRRVAEEFPDIEVEDMIVDALCMKLVLSPQRFDVLVCANLFGDIVADLCAGLVGGSHNSPSINIADGARVYTVGHGDPADVALTERASPTSLFFAAVLMLRDLGENGAADRLMKATSDALEQGHVPLALGGSATTTAFADAVVGLLA
ncbi:MAG: NAD-dependent isocitrate dehydrogenase [Myxococcales bacterium]|nr:NAD-dependent isocitrate dehydrogenase [Myxococcales bacterium]